MKLEGYVYERQAQYLPLTYIWLVTYPVLPMMSIIRDTNIKSEACSALRLESSSGGNTYESIKGMTEVH